MERGDERREREERIRRKDKGEWRKRRRETAYAWRDEGRIERGERI